VQWGEMVKIKLPIDSFKEQILATIKNNPVTVIVAETGAGKSTRVPQLLLEATDYEVVVTQPRRVAAKSVARRVAHEMDCRFGGLVAFRTAVDRNDSVETRCLFATDGLQLVRELTSQKQTIGNGVVLLIDEVHEWNQNIETLVAWVKKAILEGADIKVVLMSATLDHGRLSNFFDNAPVIEVPGRCFPVVGSPSTGLAQKGAYLILEEIKRLVTAGMNTLVFLPGKKEISDMQGALQKANMHAVVLPLHGELEPDEQDSVFDSYHLPKVILSTNIAQTSVTIQDIDAVVDSGLERRIELLNNVETLRLANISQADCLQRAGRAGRVREGEYVLCNDTRYSSFSQYPVPEILRTLLDQMVLRLAGAGLDATQLPFYHQPDPSVLAEAKETLMAIEALDAQGKITKLGHKINKFPTDVKAARMILEAIDRKCLAPVLTIAAILGVQGSSLKRRRRDDDPEHFLGWENLIDADKKYQSDLLVELELFWHAKELGQSNHTQNGIMPKAYGKALEIRGQLREALQELGYRMDANNQNAQSEEEILKSVTAGMVVHLYRHTGGGTYENGGTRKLAKESIIYRLSSYPDWIVGEPFNISFVNRRGRRQTIELVSNVTVVEPTWMVEIAPHLVSKKVERLSWNSDQRTVTEDHVTIFNGQEIAREKKPAQWRTEVFNFFVDALMRSYSGSDVADELYRANTEILNQYQAYYVRSGGTIQKMESLITRDLYMKVLEPYRIQSLTHFENLIGNEVSKDELRISLSQLISSEEIARIERENPLVMMIEGKEFSITYSQPWSEFMAKIEVTEEFICGIELKEITLPNREVKISCGGYTQTLREHRERVQANLVNNFKNQIANTLSVPQEEPFCSGYTNSQTELGTILKNQFETFRVQMSGGLTLDNLNERVELVKTQAEEIKLSLRASHGKAKDSITSSEEKINSVFYELKQKYIENEISQMREELSKAKTSLQKGEFSEAREHCEIIELQLSSLTDLANERKMEEERIKKVYLPEGLIRVFSGDVDCAIQFMSHIKKIETYRLDEHEITCGRARARQNMEDAWRAMSEESDFFCGADPNDVKHFVWEYHFGSTQLDESEEDQDDNSYLSTHSADSDLQEALRKAGLI